jgi:hypothetical protein
MVFKGRMRRSLRASLAAAAVMVAACSPGATGSRSATDLATAAQSPEARQGSGPSPTPSISVVETPSPSVGTCDPATTNFTDLHQAPELEALLPGSVAGRSLARWSVRGRSWPELGSLTPSDIDSLLAPFENPSDPSHLALAQLTYGVAGRSDTKTDPPFFVFGAARPQTDDQIAVALFLMFGGAGFHSPDPAKAADLTGYQEKTIAGKQVYVGTVDVLGQDEHQRGRPYLYQTDANMFLVITDDDSWAADAIGQLP